MLCLVPLFLNLSNAQDELTTGNLINQSTWEGCYVSQPTRTWAGYSGGWCPNVGKDGSGITFGYGMSTLAQTISVNKALELSGTDIQVTGYNYSWTVKNSNINNEQANRAGGVDPLAFKVSLFSSSGSLLEQDTYDYGYRIMQWTTFSGSRTYTNPYQAATLGNLNLSISGYDVGYWAGYYGPEVSQVDLSLKYRQVASTPNTHTPAPATNSTIYALPISPVLLDSTKTSETSVNVGGLEMSTSGSLLVPDSIPQVVKDSAVKEEAPKSNITSILNTIKRIQEADKVVQTQAVQNAQQQATSSIAISQETNAVQEFSSNNTVTNPLAGVSYQKAATYFVQETPQPQVSNVSTVRVEGLANVYTQQALVDTQASVQQSSNVKRISDSNELAGNTNIGMLAVIPQGYSAYTSIVLPDARFYVSKEIYKGQQNVDNSRALRVLGSDQKHQQMVQSQYR